MNPRLVNTAAGVIHAALTQNRTAAGIALALDSAGLLLTPDVVAELQRLGEQVAELEQRLERVKKTSAGPAETVTVEPAEDVTPQVLKLRGILAVQRAALEDQHESPLHHDYRVGRDLPETGGTR